MNWPSCKGGLLDHALLWSYHYDKVASAINLYNDRNGNNGIWVVHGTTNPEGIVYWDGVFMILTQNQANNWTRYE
jgi:hypothetical protein